MMVYKTIAYAVLLGTSVMAAPTPQGDDNVNQLSGHMREALIPIPVPVGVPSALPVPVPIPVPAPRVSEQDIPVPVTIPVPWYRHVPVPVFVPVPMAPSAPPSVPKDDNPRKHFLAGGPAARKTGVGAFACFDSSVNYDLERMYKAWSSNENGFGPLYNESGGVLPGSCKDSGYTHDVTPEKSGDPCFPGAYCYFKPGTFDFIISKGPEMASCQEWADEHHTSFNRSYALLLDNCLPGSHHDPRGAENKAACLNPNHCHYANIGCCDCTGAKNESFQCYGATQGGKGPLA